MTLLTLDKAHVVVELFILSIKHGLNENGKRAELQVVSLNDHRREKLDTRQPVYSSRRPGKMARKSIDGLVEFDSHLEAMACVRTLILKSGPYRIFEW